ncbi:ATP-dependent DNA ligase I [Moesziomyces antarcticus T-34]|uniref:ATP-dependent DNA ligase I n=1 Tax=Pseudozyma antarctica (strain T-34) TaxID=1151754 RepID=M9MFX3_PSEA3|nr:ATP-dependent DNA ligase I [Moesziomyces antarcticus T-34]
MTSTKPASAAMVRLDSDSDSDDEVVFVSSSSRSTARVKSPPSPTRSNASERGVSQELQIAPKRHTEFGDTKLERHTRRERDTKLGDTAAPESKKAARRPWTVEENAAILDYLVKNVQVSALHHDVLPDRPYVSVHTRLHLLMRNVLRASHPDTEMRKYEAQL